MLVIGEREVTENKIAIRRQGKGDAGIKDVDEFVNELREEIRESKVKAAPKVHPSETRPVRSV